MITWLLNKIFGEPSEEDKRVIAAINKLHNEYDVRIGPRGGMSKTSKPEFVEKHRREHQEMCRKMSEVIKMDKKEEK